MIVFVKREIVDTPFVKTTFMDLPTDNLEAQERAIELYNRVVRENPSIQNVEEAVLDLEYVPAKLVVKRKIQW